MKITEVISKYLLDHPHLLSAESILMIDRKAGYLVDHKREVPTSNRAVEALFC